MKPPQPCTCHVHQTEDYSRYSRDLKLNRQVRKDCLTRAKKLRGQAETETDRSEKAILEKIAVCAEWSAWLSLQIIREVKAKNPRRIQP